MGPFEEGGRGGFMKNLAVSGGSMGGHHDGAIAIKDGQQVRVGHGP